MSFLVVLQTMKLLQKASDARDVRKVCVYVSLRYVRAVHIVYMFQSHSQTVLVSEWGWCHSCNIVYVDVALSFYQPSAIFRIGRPRRRGRERESVTDVEGEEDELSELEGRIQSANLPEHALKAAQKELKVWEERERERERGE